MVPVPDGVHLSTRRVAVRQVMEAVVEFQDDRLTVVLLERLHELDGVTAQGALEDDDIDIGRVEDGADRWSHRGCLP